MKWRRNKSAPPRFKRPRVREPGWFRRWGATALVVIALTVWWVGIRPIVEKRDWIGASYDFAICGANSGSAAGCVMDGDTLIIGFGKDRRRIRLTGYDAPELKGACPAESAMAIKARDALHQWLSRGPFQWDGADEPPRDQYGRELREISRAGEDESREYLAKAMIDAGLASENGWGAVPRDWCS